MKINEKQRLENYIYNLLKESIYEHGFEKYFFMNESKEEKHKNFHHKFHKDDDEETKEKQNIHTKRSLIQKWLDSNQNLHSVLAYKLFPDIDRDSARSEFSKKYRQENDEYEFDDEEINKLYGMRDRYIKVAGLHRR